MSILKKIPRLFKKVLKYLKTYGLIKTVKKVIKTIYFRLIFRNRKKQAAMLAGLVDISQYNTFIIFENNFGWNKIMKQRPQQMAENLPSDTLMFYHSHEDADFPEKKKRARLLKDNLLLIDLGYFRDAVFELLTNQYNKYLMVYSTDYIPYERIQLYEEYRYKVIYEYVDDINEELSGDSYNDLCARHESVLNDNNVYIVSTATKLKNNIDSTGKKTAALITNGGDYDHFKYKEYPLPEDLAPIRAAHKTLLCYYGALATWFDYELIKKIAENRELGIVLIGQDYDDTLTKSGVTKLQNVYFLGKKAYSELPAYGCNTDIFIIPFVINEITESTSPVKLFEYMAMEKPIITTALPECKKYKSVFFSANHDEFISNIDLAVKAAEDEEYRAIEIKEATENNWTSKAADMVEFINSQYSAQLNRTISEVLNKHDYERIIIWRSPFGWNVPLFQRPQHIARQFARQNCLVIYEISLKTDTVLTMKEIEPNLFLVNYEDPYLVSILEDRISKQDKPVYVQIYSTNWSMSMDEVKAYNKKGFKLLYEYIDDISPELAGTDEIPEYILDKYNYAMTNKDIPVVTTAKQIYADVVSKRGEKNMVFACNGVDYDFFQQFSSDFEYEKEFLDIVNNGKINLCYYGALAKWFDYELIKAIDATDKYNIILIGIKYDDAYDASGIDALKNVYFIGPRDYAVLKYYAAKMDILTIPFVINSITQATSPLKLFEYMALHKPIVTSAMTECKNYASVFTAETHSEFISLLEVATQKMTDDEYMALLDKEARENDWSHKAEAIINLLAENEKR